MSCAVIYLMSSILHTDKHPTSPPTIPTHQSSLRSSAAQTCVLAVESPCTPLRRWWEEETWVACSPQTDVQSTLPGKNTNKISNMHYVVKIKGFVFVSSCRHGIRVASDVPSVARVWSRPRWQIKMERFTVKVSHHLHICETDQINVRNPTEENQTIVLTQWHHVMHLHRVLC